MSAHGSIVPVPSRNVEIGESFFRRLMRLAADRIIPYQWEALNDRVPDAEPSRCIRNFRAAAGQLPGVKHSGYVFQDSDLAKWLEAASETLIWNPNTELEKQIEEAVDLIAEAQTEDGYLDTYYILNGIENRWTNLRDHHEMYCAGHMLEAAVACYLSTGKRKLLDVMLRFVDHIAERFGPEEGKLRGYPGHEEIELALMKLYEVTGDPKHLNLAKFFIDERGTSPSFFDAEADRRGDGYGWGRSIFGNGVYYQSDKPVRDFESAHGHAVRQGYLLCGMADVARETGDESLIRACERLWKDITRRQMYITGAVGQSSAAEAFSFDYDLPNALVYGETCAAISMYFFAQRMMRLSPKGEYCDIMDRLLYNGTISGMNLEGNRFFYVNPLESWPERSEKNAQFTHVKSERQKWFGCACCPPNLARMIAQLPGSCLYAQGDTLYAALYSSYTASAALKNGNAEIRMETEYPWNGRVSVRVSKAFTGFTLALRLPAWCKSYRLTVNGNSVLSVMDDGFLYITRDWSPSDELVLDMDMPVLVMRAHPRVRENAQKIAIQRGPVVYCLEEADNGQNLSAIRVRADAPFTVKRDPDTLGGIPLLECPAKRLTERGWDETELYADAHEPDYEETVARFVPYYAWNNRGAGEMTVWIHEDR